MRVIDQALEGDEGSLLIHVIIVALFQLQARLAGSAVRPALSELRTTYRPAVLIARINMALCVDVNSYELSLFSIAVPMRCIFVYYYYWLRGAHCRYT